MNQMNRLKARNEKENPGVAMAAVLFMMYVISGLLLVVLALLLYNLELSEATVKIGIIAIYILSGFTGGLLMGKRMQDKKYLWGLLVGGMYFILLFLLSVGVKIGTAEEMVLEPVRILTTFLLSIVSGMAGGMVS